MKKLYTLLLTLSFATVSTQAATQTIKYKIKSGDSLYAIAKKNKTTVSKVRQANGMKKGETLKVGKVLKVPTNKKMTKKKLIKLSKYKIKKGDTLFSIASRHHTTIAKLTRTNGMKKGDTLKLGRTIKVPKTIYVAKKKKTSNKKLVASLSNLDTVSLASTTKTKKSKNSNAFAFSDIFTNSKKADSDKCKKITKDAKRKLGKRYVWGASGTKNTYDCSSFTKYVYRKNGIAIPRTSINQSKHGKYVKRKDLKKGDLIFFDTSKRRKGYVNHVGIYLGNNKFIHASSAKKRVVVSSLSKFYGKRYKGARRPS
ncbi:MAG: C40 family peptidase [Flavobacteriaceae bacterium]|nr:C40 family peptidase [Flavobacteriaceae bacterium]